MVLVDEEYQGVKILDREEAQVRHPRWGDEKPRPFEDATLLVLADGVWLVVCNFCKYNGITGSKPYVRPENDDYKPIVKQANSVFAHQTATHLLKAPRKALYTDEQIKVAISVFLKWQSIGVRNWTRGAADELDRRGFKPLNGARWSISALSKLVHSYKDKPKFRNVKAASMEDPVQAAMADMVRESAAREAAKPGARASVARAARITMKHTHTPVDWAGIIEQQQSDRTEAVLPSKEEEAVPSNAQRRPTLNFGRSTEPALTKTLPLGQRIATPEPIVLTPAAQPQTLAIDPAKVRIERDGDFEFIDDLDGGVGILIRYKGKLMVAKPVKDFLV